MSDKRLWLLPLVLAALAAVVLLAPRLIDQGWLRGWVAAQLQRGLGQPVAIDGPVTLSLLPRPSVSAEDVTLAAGARLSGRLPRIEADLQLLPLLRGRLRPDSLRLLAPNLTLQPSSPALAPPEAAVSMTPEAAALAASGLAAALMPAPPAGTALTLVIERGRLTLANGVVLAPLALALQLRDDQASLQGRLGAAGSGVALTAEARWQLQRLAALSLALQKDGGGDLRWSGQPTTDGRVAGTLSGRIDSLARLSPGWPALPATLAAELQADATEIEARELRLTLGDSEWRGNAQLSRGESPRLEVTLQGGTLDLDRMPALTTASAPAAAAAAVPAVAPGAATGPDHPPPALPGLPGLALQLTLGVDQLLWRGAVLQDARLELLADRGEITVNQAGVTLPGNSQLSLVGVISVGSAERGANGPLLTGSFEGKSDDLRQALSWAGVDLSRVPADRLHVARLAGRISATATEISLAPVMMKLDSSQIDLTLGYHPAAPTALRLTLAVDQLNADAYWSAPGPASPPSPAAASAALPAAASAASPSSAAALTIALRGQIKRLMWRGVSALDAAFDAGWQGQRLTLTSVSVRDLAGSRLALAGALTQGDGAWRWDGAKAELHSPDLGRTLRAFAIDLPLAVPVDLAAAIEGPLDRPTVQLSAPELVFGPARLTAPQARLLVEPGRLRLDPLQAGLFGGQLSGDASLQQDSGALSLHLVLEGAQARQALLDVADLGLADGLLRGDLTLATSGHFLPEMKARLAGNGQVAVTDGQIRGFDLKAADRSLAAQGGVLGLLGLLQVGLNGGSTHFSSLTGSARVERGVIRSDDLRLVAEGGGAHGALVVDLPTDTIEAHADFAFASATDAPPLVMRLNGPLASPRRTLDVKPLQQWLAEHGVKTGKPKDVLKGLLQGLIH